MEWLFKKAEEFLKRHKFINRWKKVLAVMMSMVVFLTTYAMILPAITLETDMAEPIGLYVEAPPEPEPTETPPQAEEPAGPMYLIDEELTFENENLSITLTVPEAAKVPADAALTVREIGRPFANDGLDEKGREDEYLSYLAAAEEALHFTAEESTYIANIVKNEPAAGVPWFRFFVLSVENAEGAIVPACQLPARVIFKNTAREAADGLKVLSLGADGKLAYTGSENSVAEAAEMKLVLVATTDDDYDITVKFMDAGELAFGTFAVKQEEIAAAIEGEKEAAAVAAAETEEAEDESGKAEDTSVPESADEAVPVEGASTEEGAKEPEKTENEAEPEKTEAEPEKVEAEPEKAENEPEKTEDDPEKTDAEPAEEKAETEEEVDLTPKTLEVKGADYTVTMTYTGEAMIPEGATLSAEEILADDTDYEKYVNDAAEALDLPEGQSARVRARFFDIKIMVGEEEVTPAAPVRVEISYEKPQEMAAAENMSAVHFKEEGEKPEVVEIADVTTDEKTEEVSGVAFDADSFSVYGVVYTVDFVWEVDGETYEFNLEGGGYIGFTELAEILKVAEDVEAFAADIANVEFSDPSLMWVGKAEEETTVGALKAANGLESQYSSELTEADIEEINAQTVNAGEWALISLQPFDTEETLTVTMGDGEQFVVKVTDATEISDTASIDVNKSYVLCVKVGNTYQVLKTNGTTTNAYVPDDFNELSNDYKWTFYYVFEEKDENNVNYGKTYYFIRPISDKSKTLALNAENEALVQNDVNNVAVMPQTAGGFILEGYSSTGDNVPTLYFDGTNFIASFTNSSNIKIYELEALTTYDYTVISNDYDMGSVTATGTEYQDTDGNTYYISESTADKKNANVITAVPNTLAGSNGVNKYKFDHWELDGKTLYQRNADGTYLLDAEGNRQPVGETIAAETITIPNNSSILKAFFKVDETYVAKDEDKDGTEFSDMETWLQNLTGRDIPLNPEGCKKTAEVVDYENRIYRVDMTAQSNLSTFDGSIDLGFVIDCSASMKFPAKLIKLSDTKRKISTINSSNWSTWGLQTGKTYYIIGDPSGTATVCALYHNGSEWRLYDSSKSESNSFAVNSSSYSYYTPGDSYVIYEAGNLVTQEEWDDLATRTLLQGVGITGVDKPKNRAYYLESSISSTLDSLSTLLNALAVASGTNNPDVKIAYNTFYKKVDQYHPDFTSVKNGITIDYAYDGGTHTDYALADADPDNGNSNKSALTFDWKSSKKYALLITDGAPQHNGTAIFQKAKDAAAKLKKGKDGVAENADDIELVTVGLSMADVLEGKKMLYDMADVVNGEKAFYLAESDQLEDILLHILDVILEDATIQGDVTDTISEAFYPVDKATGKPLSAFDRIDLEGNKVDSSYLGDCGVVQADGRTIVWENQDFTWEGWQGTVYVKAKEDLLGGNALLTNDGDALIESKTYRLREGGTEYPLADEDDVTNDKYEPDINLDSPHVNVNELTVLKNNTDWTVYLGEEVDPKQQLQKLYESILVEEVVTKGKDTDSDTYKIPDTIAGTGELAYPMATTTEEGVSDQRENVRAEEVQTFKLADLIRELIDDLIVKEGNSSSWKAYITQDDDGNDILNWDKVIEQALTTEGLVIPYNRYGIGDVEHTMADGTTRKDQSVLKITLTKEIVEAEKVYEGEGDDRVDVTEEVHNTKVIGDAVEKYTLTANYLPDYTILPRGQGGKSNEHFHVGTYWTNYQGSAPGTEERANIHIINVYAQPLDVLKMGDDGYKLSGAEFKLYREAENDETGETLTNYDADLKATNGYICVATATSNENGIARLTNPTTGMTVDNNVLLPGVTYYLIETQPPTRTEGGKTIKYVRDRSVKIVTVETQQDGNYTDLEGTSIPAKTYPFNWDQGARILVDGTPVTVIAHDPEGEEGATMTITDGSFVTKAAAISFQTTILNGLDEASLTVVKTWEGVENPPESVTFKLYRTAYVSHDWDDGVVTTTGSCTTDGEITYTCHRCGATRTVAIAHEGHKAGTPVQENYVAPTCEEAGSYDEVTYCTVCGAELSRVSHTIAATGHDWGEWEVTTPPTYEADGVETRVCKNDPTHVETRPIDKLKKMTHITYRINTYWYHDNNMRADLYFRQETVTTTEEYEVGSKVNISWTDAYPSYTALLYKDVTPSSGWYGRNYYWFTGNTSTNVTHSGSNYTVNNITVTDNMVIDICLGTQSSPGAWSEYYYSHMYSPNSFQITSNGGSKLMSTRARTLTGTSSLDDDVTLEGAESVTLTGSADSSVTLTGAGDSSTAAVVGAGSNVLTHEQLQTLLNGFETKDYASNHCELTYCEEVGEYTITKNASGQWVWTKNDIVKYDEWGNEYTYYVVETNTSDAYEITYLNEDEGLSSGETATIHNKLVKVSVEILKLIDGTTTPIEGVSFTLTQVDANGNNISGGVTATGTTDADGKITFSNIVVGRYKLEENAVPTGFVKEEGPYYINVTKNGTDSVDDSANLKYIAVSSSEHSYTIENVPGAQLPHTGGEGTMIFYIIGVMMTMIAGVGVAVERKKRMIG